MKKVVLLMIFIATIILGCASKGPQPKTQLQIREFQTRSYDTNNTKLIMKAMLHVLQDDGFIVKNAVVDLGLLTAEKQMDVENKRESFFSSFWSGNAARWKKALVTECSANISEFGKQTRVRINFQERILDNKGGIMGIRRIDDPIYYQVFFTKVAKGIFIQKEKL